ncbi:protease inhibitor I42 family protein [Deinococcus sp. HMF7604]|uniref:protease inhibitor I42 family protein n=1 Tax=Deinococcus betulae TaxID=2873312 RepID=UPI001CCC46EB|nr:protease inhibitor I42 family protein [Deinococcus betulae]MBZ9749584.1 protease inhibitor I42 family protein [Deinococcus betulae]
MPIRMMTLFCAALLLLGISAAPPAPRTLSFTVGAAGQDIAVQPGDLLRFSLSAAAGTGYTWRALEVDPAFLTLVEKRTSSVVPAQGGVPVVGGPGPLTVYTYRVTAALKQGTTDLTVPLYFAHLPPGRAFTADVRLVQFNLVAR